MYSLHPTFVSLGGKEQTSPIAVHHFVSKIACANQEQENKKEQF